MLLEFRVKNFRSFRSEEVLSLRSSNDTALPGNICADTASSVLRSAAIFGANASGKTNLLLGIGALASLARFSATTDGLLSILGFSPFRFAEGSADDPCEISTSFIAEGIRYEYGFCATESEVREEWLYAYPKNYARLLYQRVWVPKTRSHDWKFGRSLKGEKWRLVEQTRQDALFISVAARWNQPQLRPVSAWLSAQIAFIPAGAELINRPTLQLIRELQSEQQDGSKGLMDLVLHLLRFADPTITGLRVETVSDVGFPALTAKQNIAALISGAKDAIGQAMESELETIENLQVYVTHSCLEDGEEIELFLEDESDGTRRLFNLIKALVDVLVHGMTLVVDEIERSLHPHLVWEIVRFIHRASKDGPCPQLVFSTHDTSLLDPELLRRDQIWFTEKRRDGSTELFPLSDFKRNKARRGDSWRKGYLSGKYGAVPVFERFERDD